MRAFDRDLIRGGHYGQRPVCRANRPNTWLHRPACKREENPCQLGAVHTWHFATIPCAAEMRALLEVKRTCSETVSCVGVTRLTQSGHKPDRNPATQQAAAMSAKTVRRRARQFWCRPE